MKIRDLVVAIIFLLIGATAASSFSAKAQSEANVSGAWEITHGSYGQQSFYVIKHNRVTGETLVLDAERGSLDNGWQRLPENDKTAKRH